jgi:5-methyltetrahydrofolate corrinoid/iron sulfur protein methyltransferase
MIAIADNLNTRNKAYMDALTRSDKNAITELIKKLAMAGADIINVQCSLDGSGDEDTLPWVTGILSEAFDGGVSLDSRNARALRKSIPLCNKPPLVNFISKTEPEDKETIISLVADSGASVVIRASGSTVPSSLETKLQIIEDLLDITTAADIPNDRIYLDPSIVHMGRGMGQKHLANSRECVLLLKDLIDPPINTIAWISNVSTGLPVGLRKPLEASFLTYMAGAGLDAAMVDILDENIRKTIYLIKAFRDEIVFSQADIT